MQKRFDVIVVGAGSGLIISSAAADMGKKVAVIEQDAFGGTCLNHGCIPSKILIHSADVALQVERSKFFGINAKIWGIDWKKIMQRTAFVDKQAKEIEIGSI